ncbi:MAG: Gfo/Idh/MocA family oxidoreductase [Eubacteriales bacterium]|nr:Gfo/Idh/MocA family oxidoreductase [Eubacteriales bacterium]
MKQCADETGQILSIGVCNRFDTTVNRIKKHIEDGELGEVYHVYISFRAFRSIPGLGGAFTTKAIAGGGALIDWGVHFIDLVMYCLGDPKPLTVSGQAFSKLGKDIGGYTCTKMWAGPRNLNGVYDVEDSIAGFIRTTSAALTLNGAWAQNIGENEMFIDFIGDLAGIRMQYDGKYTMYKASDNALLTINPDYEKRNKYEAEIDSFIDQVRNQKTGRADITRAMITSQIMQAVYNSSEANKEIIL